MEFLENILSQGLVQKLGWTLVHFVWQAGMVALLLAILLKLLHKSSANLRYIVACLALVIVVLLPAITMNLIPVTMSYSATEFEPEPAAITSTPVTIEQLSNIEAPVIETQHLVENVTVSPRIPFRERITEALEPFLPYVVLGWLVGVFGLSVWHLGGWTQLQRLRRSMVKPVDESLRSKLKELAGILGVHRVVQLMESALVQAPIVVGWLKPVILLPASALTGFSADQLEAILAHELAHIKRYDYMVNMLQTVVEILGFYHPAVWWVSKRIRVERENCCDDIAVRVSGDSIGYAKTLASFEEIQAGQPELAVAASGGNLFKRICRLLGKDKTDKTGFSWIPAATAILLILALVIPTALALTIKSESQEGQKPVEPQLIKLNSLPDGWKINYHSGMRPSGMARDLVQLRALPTPANEYDESWKEERLEFRIRSLNDERMGSILFWGERRRFDRITLSPGKYLLSYTRERTDPKTSCLIKMNRVEFPVDLSRRGTYTLVFSPKLEPLKTTDNKSLPTTCTGRVVGSKGDPLASAKVAAYELYFDMAGNVKLRLIGEAVTKADGNFFFETRPSVRKNRSMGAEVVAQKEGLAVGWALWPLYGTQRATITLQEPTKLSGKVVDENGSSIPNADVRAVLFKKKTFREEKTRWLAGIQPFNWLSVHTDRDGRFEFNNIPENSASDLLVTASGFSTIYSRRPDRIDKGYEWAEFTAGQTDIKITMPIEAKIEGKVVNKRTGEGVAKVTLRVVPYFTPVFFERYLCTTKEDGTFNIGGLRSGKYVIMRAGISNPNKVDVVVESGKTTRNVILEIPYEVRNPRPAQSGIVTPNENEQESDSQVWDDILLGTPKEKESSAESSIPVPVLAKSPTPSAEDKAHVQVDCLIVEVSLNSKMDRETTIMAENLLGNKISLRDIKVDVLLRKAAGATAVIEDESTRKKRVTKQEFNALVEMLTSRGYIKILMNPTLEVINGKTAKISSSQHVPLQVITKTIPGAAGLTTIVSTETEYIDVVDSLEITPHVFADGHIILEVKAVLGSQGISESEEQTPISLRELYTRVRVSPGESRIIGGLTEKDPAPGDNVKNSKKRTAEVLFILTPTIITPATDSQEKTDVRIKVKPDKTSGKLAANRAFFTPPIARIINSAVERKDCFIDFDNDKLYSQPSDFHSRAREQQEAWKRENSIDASATVSEGAEGLWGEEMVIIPLADVEFDRMTPASFRDVLQQATPGTPAVMTAIGQLPKTYVFKTREGGMGLLQILEVQRKRSPHYIKIRYKMVPRTVEADVKITSNKNLQDLGKAMVMFARDHQRKLPDSLQDFAPYLRNKRDIKWLSQKVKYLGKGKTENDRPDTVIAYDSSLLLSQQGTNVLFLDAHVEYVQADLLEKLGISKSKEVIGMDPADKAVYKQLETIIVDLSELTPTTSFSDAVEVISNSVDPPLDIVVKWKDLLENADIKPDTEINMDGLPAVLLGTGLESLLKAVAGGVTKLHYIVDNGVIEVGTPKMLPSKLYHGVYDISDLVVTTADADNLIRRITTTIEPDSWYDISDTGEGTITAYPVRHPKKFAVLQTRKIHQKIKRLLEDMHTSQSEQEKTKPEIQIESRFLMVSEDFLKDIGLDANSVHNSDAWSEHLVAESAAEPNAETYSLILDDLHVSFLLKAVGAHKGAKMLAAPRATIWAGKEAKIAIQSAMHYISGYTEPNRLSDEPEPKHDSFIKGLELQLTPNLTPDDKNILLDVDFKLSEVIGFEERKYKGKYPYSIPQTEVVSTKTRRLVPDGKTLLIGGLKITTLFKKEPRAPLLSKLPLIGKAFRSRSTIKDHKILLILVKPTISYGYEVDIRTLKPPSLMGKALPNLTQFNLRLNPKLVENKMVLVCFWDMNQRPSRNCVQNLNKRAQTLLNRNVYMIFVHAGPVAEQKLIAWLKNNKIEPPAGMSRANLPELGQSWGVRSLPWLILTDKEHIVQAEGFNINELDHKITTLRKK